MSILGMDLGGTKLAVALLEESGKILTQDIVTLDGRRGAEVGRLITDQVKKYKDSAGSELHGIGISIPGISHKKEGTVWAPNIEGWEHYPLLAEVQRVAPDIDVRVDNDRACSILGEKWLGNAKGCTDAIFLAVGTGIGAGILADDNIIQGAHDIAGAIGWMALKRPFEKKYIACGCFEYYASGEGIARVAKDVLAEESTYTGVLREYAPDQITSHHIFVAYEENDPIAIQVINEAIGYWGMATANLVSLFNPQRIIFGGGIFGPAVKFIGRIKEAADQWAQPISRTKVEFLPSALEGNASLIGSCYLTIKDKPN